jgi:hypothetical protein
MERCIADLLRTRIELPAFCGDSADQGAAKICRRFRAWRRDEHAGYDMIPE